MAKREVTVVINGEETVSEATGKADGAMGGFVGKVPGWAKSVAFLTAAFAAVAKAVGFAKDYVLDSIGAYDRYAASQTKLAAQSKLTGVSLSELNRIADEARAAFGLSTTVANDAATTVAKYASRAGDATKANELLARALDLGAASGLNAAETMEALEQGLRGQDEGFDKLLGKNPSAIWKEYADANGLAVGKMDDTTKRLAEVTALMDAGAVVAGAYSDRTESGAGAQDRLNNKIEEAKIAFGNAIQPARIFITQGLITLVEVGGRVVLAIGRVANAISVVFTGAVEGARSIVGGFTVAIGKLTGNKELEAWGRKQANAFAEFRTQLAGMERKYFDNGTAATQSAETQVVATTRVKKVTEDTDKAFDEYMKRQKAWWDILNQTTNRYWEFLGKLQPEVRKALDTTHVKNLNDALRTVQGSGDALIAKMREQGSIPPLFRETEREVGKMGGALSEAARGTSEVLDGFGALDGTARTLLGSVSAIGSTIGKIATSGLTFAGAAGLIGGVASIVSTMMQGDTERRRLLRQNNDALDRLRKDIGGLNLRITGEDLLNAQSALQSVIGQLRGGRGAANENDVRNALYAQGLSMEDFDRIAKEFGIEVRTKSGALNVDSVRAVLEALRTVQLGQVGSDFQSQLDFFRESQDLAGEEGATRAANLLRFLQSQGNVGALAGLDLSDPARLREQLTAIRAQLNTAGGIDETQLGRLSGGDLNRLLVDVIGLLTGPSTGGGGTVSLPDVGGGSGVSVPVDTVQSVIKAMDANLSTILTTHTTLHERIAVATEGSYGELQQINAKMDTLISVSGGTDRTDAALEAERFALAVQQGRGVAF